MSSDDPLDPPVTNRIELTTYALSTAIYAERVDGRILLLQRAEGSAMAGQYFLPGGLVDPGEEPFEAAVRELKEEAGLDPAEPLSMVGCYPLWVYGTDMLMLSFRARITGEVELSSEHTGQRWVDPAEFAKRFTADSIEAIAGGDDRITKLLGHIGADLDRYLELRPQERRT